jgi:hypothetical protein
MTQSIIDTKLKRFIELSLEGNQIRIATSVMYMLVSNIVDEIGYKLGLIPRRKDSNEQLSAYMELVNKIFRVNFEISIFGEQQITAIKVVETLIERKKSHEEFTQTYLKELTQIYFDLRKMQIPNLQEHLKNCDTLENRTVSLMSLLSKHNQIHSRQKSPFKPLLLHRIHQDQKQLTMQLQDKLDHDAMLRLIQLKSIEKSLLSQSGKKKIQISSNLQDCIDYSFLMSNLGRFGILGIIIIFIMIGSVCIAEMLMVGFVTAEMGGLLLICILMALAFIYMNKKWYSIMK